ncbi:unnamed protein product [Toxocara canis]|uniref:Uncharacterized protein n=1 Tax=Toxocara canis TaxID=6265 RepID=A0A183V2C4_TOXCA|nr:unnamed protein product [Toxocara canis]
MMGLSGLPTTEQLLMTAIRKIWTERVIDPGTSRDLSHPERESCCPPWLCPKRSEFCSDSRIFAVMTIAVNLISYLEISFHQICLHAGVPLRPPPLANIGLRVESIDFLLAT